MESTTTVVRVQSVSKNGKNGMSEAPKLNSLASKLFAKNKKEQKPLVEKIKSELKDEERDPAVVHPASSESSSSSSSSAEHEPMDIDEPKKVEDDASEHEEIDSEAEEVKIPAKPARSIGRKPLPRRHRGAVGAIRLNQSRRVPVYRKMTLFRLVNQIVRKEMGLKGMQFSKDSVAMIATAMENIMYRKVAPGQLLSLSGGKSSLMLRHALLGLKLQSKPDMRNWSRKDFTDCDGCLEKSQFRNTELDVDVE